MWHLPWRESKTGSLCGTFGVFVSVFTVQSCCENTYSPILAEAFKTQK